MKELRKITKQLFKDIVKEYEDIETKSDFQDKVKHSSRVAKNAEIIGTSEGLDSDFSYIIGLLHDIGRFEQTRRELGFNDDDVLDHGNFGEEMLEARSSFLENFSEKQAYILKKAIKNHNKYNIEDNLDEETLAYCKMIRDADKVDIINYSSKKDIMQTSYNLELLEQYNKGVLADNRLTKTPQDYILKNLSFRFDINFEITNKMISAAIKSLENKFIDKEKLRKFD